MAKNYQTQTPTSNANAAQSSPSGYYKPSTLEKFSIDFEYNKSLQDIKRDVRTRTHKT